jgi:DNA-binding NtrC family response regulator
MELENSVERTVILADSGKKIEAELLGLVELISSESRSSKAEKAHITEEPSEPKTMEELEKIHTFKVLAACGGNSTHAAVKRVCMLELFEIKLIEILYRISVYF